MTKVISSSFLVTYLDTRSMADFFEERSVWLFWNDWKQHRKTFNEGHLCPDAPFTPGVSTNQNVDLLVSGDDIIWVYLQKRDQIKTELLKQAHRCDARALRIRMIYSKH